MHEPLTVSVEQSVLPSVSIWGPRESVPHFEKEFERVNMNKKKPESTRDKSQERAKIVGVTPQG